MSDENEPVVWIDPALWDAAVVPFEAVDLNPYIKACEEEVRDLVADAVGPDIPVYLYDPKPAPPSPFEEGVTTGYQVVWSGGPGPGLLRRVELLVDGDGVVVVEPTGEWQDTTVVDDREERP